jgi:hypothetical protein
VFEQLKAQGFEILALHHAEAILKHDMPQAIEEIEAVLLKATLPVRELVLGGGGEGALTQRLRHDLADNYGWKKHNFDVDLHLKLTQDLHLILTHPGRQIMA